MKDLTHYFQSPNKIVDATISSQEDSVVIEKSSTHELSSSVCNGSVSPFEIACKSEGISNIETLNVNEPEESRIIQNRSEIRNGRRCPKTSRNLTNRVNGIANDEKLQEYGEHLVENSGSELKETSLRIEFSGKDEKCSPENTSVHTQVSPNAFHILMSTQQIFGSTNSGKKECLDVTNENDSLKHGNRKKVKESLEKMAKRKLEMEANISVCENSIGNPAKKRRRIIVETDSESETTPVKKSIPDVLDEAPGKKHRKQLDLKGAVKSKKRKSDKLYEDASVSSPNDVQHLMPQKLKLSSKTKNSECQESDIKKSKGLKVKIRNEQKVLAEQSDIVFDNVTEKDTVHLEVISNLSGKEKYNESDPVVIVSTNDSSDSTDATKKKSNILNYFNKVTSDVKRRHSEKIKITVDVHFPIVPTDKMSKKVVMKKKSKRKGQREVEDDIQLIDSEVIEKPDLPISEADKSTSVISLEEKKKTFPAGNKHFLKTCSDSEGTHTPSHKDWKLRIRMPSNSVECTPSPVKQPKKQGSPLKKKKLKLISGKRKNATRDQLLVKVVPKNEPDELILSNTPKKVEKEKTTIKKKLSTQVEHSPSSISPLKSKKLTVKSIPVKIEGSREKDNCNIENEKQVVTDSTPLRKKSVCLIKEMLDGQSTKSTNYIHKGKSKIFLDKQSTKVTDSTSKRRRSLFIMDSYPALKRDISGSKRSPLAKKCKQEEEQTVPKNTVSTSLKRNSDFLLEDSPVKKNVAKKKSPIKKSPIKKSVKNESTVERNMKKETVTPKRNVKSHESSEGEEEPLSINMERDESSDKEETPASGRTKRSCTTKDIMYAEDDADDDDCSSKKSNRSEMLVSAGKRGTSRRMCLQAKKIFSSVQETSKKSGTYKSSTSLRSSSRKKATSLFPDYGISDDEDDCEDFGSDSDDDFFGDSDDFGDTDEDFNSNSDNYNDDDDNDEGHDDNDEPIILVSKKKDKTEKNFSKGRRAVSKRKIASAKGIMLDQEVVLQFLEKAKGTLNRKMALHDPENFPCKQSDDAEEIQVSAPMKFAPLFVSQKTKKPDKAILMARKTFLQSGVPEVVKKMVETQKLAEEQEYVEFPSVSHIQQREDGATVWNLSEALLKFPPHAEESSLCTSLKIPFNYFTKCDLDYGSTMAYNASQPPKIRLFRDFLRAIKAESPDFPVYRTFRYLFGANPPQQTESAKCGSTKRGRRKSNVTSKKEQGSRVQDSEQRCAAWTSKYRPLTSDGILGNGYSVGRFKKWLELWMQVKENTFQKNFKEVVSSGDEFLNDSGDDESEKTISPKQSVVLMGPTGSGKTMTVYTLAHELGYKVLEVNAASKRTGRRILSELQEATQSHHVHGKGEENSAGIKSFFTPKGKSEKVKPLEKKESDQQTNKLSLILIEDVDIVFEEEDEGFVSALSTLLIGSKRPVVLITSDPSCPHLSRFLEKSLLLEFKAAPCKLISVWMQLVSLLEGVRVRKSCVEELLRYNKGDARKTLLQLQFWVLSGGENHKALPDSLSESTEILDFPDDVSNSSWVSIDDKKAENQTNHPLHSQCLTTFLELDSQILQVDRGKTWWNLPKLLGLKEVTHQVSRKEKESGGNVCNEELGGGTADVITIQKNVDSEGSLKDDNGTSRKKWKSVCSAQDVKALVKLSDTLSVVETLSAVTDSVASEPYQCAWEQYPFDSLSLSQNKQPPDYGVKHTTRSISSWLVSTTINQCSAQLRPGKCVSLASVLQQQPSKEEMSWREQQHNASRELEDAVPMMYWQQRKAMATDYISCLRNIARLEQDRVCINDKRNNRFYHYLKGLGARVSPATLDTVCNVFKIHN